MMIRLENVSKWYLNDGKQSEPVLYELNLTIPDRQFVCILGPSGCGKTTLLNLVAGFITPSRGHVFFDDAPIEGPGPERGVVFQDANLFPWLTVRKNVEFALRLRGVDHNAMRDTAGKYLDLVGMASHKNAFPHTLSGGMRQRTAISRALALEPKALLMDEPFSSLDANAREHLQDELLKIWQHQQRTLIYITHSVEEAAYLADRVIVMGPSPQNIRGDMLLQSVRPRKRSSEEMRNATAELRAALDSLPCCV
jgi:NitT/TauT family transport system ATP-binding protein